jgi:hypothetical protein
MKKWTWMFIGACLFLAGSVDRALAQPVSMKEARLVAENWVRAIIHERETWGTAQEAQIDGIQEFRRKGRPVGYFCRVSPKGYILVSPRREMAPVKAYSATSDLDPASEEGLADLLKGKMERILDKVQRIARERKAVTGKEVADNLEMDYRPAWDALMNDPEGFMRKPAKQEPSSSKVSSKDEADSDGGGEASNYQEGEVLLSSNWHQYAPYNNDCPNLGCTDAALYGRALVGCVATAGAQIMYYWSWPPWGEGSPYSDTYDWPNMRDSVTTASSAAQQAAVAELSHEIGQAVGMDYGCDGSSADTYDMEGVYEDHYRYANVSRRDRDDYSATDWFNLMKEEFNYNRPVQYRITGHSVVGDGWQEIGNPVVRQYHMNYGWTGTGSDTWYTLDTLTTDPEGEEYLLENIRPEPYLTTLNGEWTRASFPYRYFYMDTTGGPGTFHGGQRIQFLPGIVVRATTGTVTFEGSASYDSYLFSRGDLSRGLKIHNEADAAIKLYSNGSIKFH